MVDVVNTQGGPSSPWVKLFIEGHLANTDDEIDLNIESVLSSDYIPFNTLLDAESGAVAIVGSGPSLKDNWERLKTFNGDLIACNAALEFLLERGIVPKYAMCFDADNLANEFAVPKKGVTYLLASRCTPTMFDRLKDCNVVVWHAAGDSNISELLTKYNKMEPMVAGGGTATTRALGIAVALGYKKLHMWGTDSSFSEGNTHIRQSTTKEKTIEIMCNKKAFITAPWMAKQAEDFKIIAPQLRMAGIRIIVHGYGLIPHIAEGLGFEVDGVSLWKNLLREFRNAIYRTTQILRGTYWKSKLFWSQL